MLSAIPDAIKMLVLYSTTAVVRLALLVWWSEFFVVWYNYYTKICGKSIDRGAADVLTLLFNDEYLWSKLKDNCFADDIYNVFSIHSHTTAYLYEPMSSIFLKRKRKVRVPLFWKDMSFIVSAVRKFWLSHLVT